MGGETGGEAGEGDSREEAKIVDWGKSEGEGPGEGKGEESGERKEVAAIPTGTMTGESGTVLHMDPPCRLPLLVLFWSLLLTLPMLPCLDNCC